MKSIVLSSVAVALLFLSGCSSKEPVVEEANQEAAKPAQEVEAVKTEVVAAEDAAVAEDAMNSADSNEMNMANLEKELMSIYFDFDKFNVRADMQSKVENDAALANGTASAFNVKLEGNCDEWGSDEYNFALGLKRAKAVKNALVAQGVAEDRISMVSFGESNPVCTDKTQECWSQNRRVDFKLLP